VGRGVSVEARVRAGGLLAAGRPVVVLLSGGQDSVCLLDVALAVGADVTVLHVNHGLRADADDDEAFCVALGSRLGVPVQVRRAPPRPAAGNVHAWAREVRYGAARSVAARLGAGVDVATGHTASDQVETVLYRLAASPGRRALLGMEEREGRVVRPLLGCTRAETAAHCRARGLPWREDESNADPVFARSRVRDQLLPAFEGLHPAAAANVLRTVAVLRDEAAVLDAVVDEALRAAGWDGSDGGPVPAAALEALAPALRRLCLQRLAGVGAPAVGHRVDEVLAAAARGGTRALALGGGLRAVVVYGAVRVQREQGGGGAPADAGAAPRGDGGAAPPPDAARALPVPGTLPWGAGTLSAELGPDLPVADGTLDAAACSGGLTVRAWRAGDRMRPLGLGGSRTLQDLFTDRKVPRAERGGLPVVCAGGEIAWVPGVATGDAFRVTAATAERLRLAWRQ
jgi:tRNA(Ile)-lysidine synthase